jgi:hypothetical protein
MASTSHSSFKYFSAIGGCHALSETMNTNALSYTWLVCPFRHVSFPLLLTVDFF